MKGLAQAAICLLLILIGWGLGFNAGWQAATGQGYVLLLRWMHEGECR